MKKWSDKAKINASVVASGFAGTIVAPGVVFCAERCLPHQMNWLRNIVADHVVTPHLDFFTNASDRLLRANREAAGGAVPGADPALQGADPASDRGKALMIADRLVSTLLAWNVDFLATLGAQKLINRKLGVNSSPLKTTFVDSTVSLAAMAIMPTLAAKPSEALNHTLASIIQKTTGMPKDHAEDLSIPVVYSQIPNLLGTAAALRSAHYFGQRR